MFQLSDKELIAAKEWIGECQWAENYEDDEIEELSQAAIEKGINKHYAGGLIQFKKDCEY